MTARRVPNNRLCLIAAAAALVAACGPGQPNPSPDPPPNRATQQRTADRVFINGKILTVDQDFQIVEALAIAQSRVLLVGTDEQVLATAGPATQTIDLNGATVIPGLIDNHMHFVRASADWYRHARLDGITSRVQARELIAARAAALPPDEWVVVIGGWHFAQFVDDSSLFSRQELDRIAVDRPVYIQEGYRRGFANSRALEIAGVESRSGEVAGPAMGQIAASIPPVDPDTWDASLRQTLRDMHGMGLTSVYDVGGNGVTPSHYDAVRRAAEANELSMRVFYSLNSQHGVGSSASEIVAALESRSPDLDGLAFAQFGWGESTYGPMRAQPWNISQADLDNYETIARTAAQRGWQLHEHSMRDEKIDAMLGIFERVNEDVSIADMRWTIAHTNNISATSIARANALGVVFAVHSSSRLSTAAQVGSGANPPPVRSIDESGGIWGFGSDATTVASPNPFHNIGWIVSGESPAGERILEETVSREAALAAYTRTNAYLLFRESDLGSLEAGKLADFVVLDRDFMTVPADQLQNLQAMLTFVGGRAVFDARE